MIDGRRVVSDRFWDACPICGAQGDEQCSTATGRNHRKRNLLLLLELDSTALDALEATARAATPGPWEWEPPSAEGSWTQGQESLVTSYPGEDGYPDEVLGGWGYDASGTEASDEDRTHIATFDPPTVLALITRLREAEAVIVATSSAANNPRAALNAAEAWEVIYETREQIARYNPATTEGAS